MPMHGIFDCTKKEKETKKEEEETKKKKKKKKAKCFYMIASVFSKKCGSFMMYLFRW